MPDKIYLELELEPDRDPIAGIVRIRDVPTRPFDGWLELASAIEDARNNAAAAATAPQQDRTGAGTDAS
jgi:hypothetical protein